MPHENIDSQEGFGRVQVIWKGSVEHGEDGYVQLMTQNPDSPARFPSEEVISKGSPRPGAPEEFDAGAPTWTEPCTGFAVTLDRVGINRAIRMLRRARDAAFGADA